MVIGCQTGKYQVPVYFDLLGKATLNRRNEMLASFDPGLPTDLDLPCSEGNSNVIPVYQD
jgi:hypothetical protein